MNDKEKQLYEASIKIAQSLIKLYVPDHINNSNIAIISVDLAKRIYTKVLAQSDGA